MTRSSIIRRFCALVAVVAITAVTVFAGIPARPSHQRLVNDFANVFTAEQADSLERMLVAFDDTTSNQITIVTVADLEGYAVDDYAIKLGREWGIGTNGLEGAIPDVYAKRIIDQIMIPYFKENDYFTAVSEACDKLMGLASGEIAVKRELEDDGEPKLIHYILSIILLYFIYKWSMNGGGSGSGGNYSGGGGHVYIGPIGGGHSGGHSYGGGHSHGGGFGGFGGGSFGGGGASGSW